MAETANLLLPFLAAGQAQKHLTVNDAFERLDVLLMLAAKSRTLLSPPPAPAEGDRYVVPSGASDAWAGEDGRVAAFLNDGWRFFAAREGWRAFVEDEGAEIVFAAGVWVALTAPVAPSGAVSTLEFEHQVTVGGAQATAVTIPAGALVFGATVRVLESVGGVSGWSLGVDGAPGRYGAGLSTAAGAAISGARTAPMAHPVAIPLLLTPEGGNFTGGRLRIRLHHMALAAPDP